MTRRRVDLALGVAALTVALLLVSGAAVMIVLFLAPILLRIWLG